MSTPLAKPKQLVCCCCGQYTTGRQWWNRDTGYGICPACADAWEKNPRTGGRDELERSCGQEGVHWGIASPA